MSKPAGSDAIDSVSSPGHDCKAAVKFYEVGSGSQRFFEYEDHLPLGKLLAKYCTEAQMSRQAVSFEVWDYKVQKNDTLHSLRLKHGLQNNSIDVVKKWT